MRATVELLGNTNLGDVIFRSPFRNVEGAGRTLYYCVCASDLVWVGKADDEIACVWGLIPPSLLSDRAYLWLLHTDLVDQHPFVFIRWSQRCVEMMLKEYPVLVGHCQLDSPRSVRWLKFLGATFGYPDGLKVPFEIRRR